MRYPSDLIYEEVAFLAYYFHWDYETILNMEHRERQRWCEEISSINRELNSDGTKSILDIRKEGQSHGTHW